MDISIVVAVSENGVIGKDNQLIWHLKDDLKLFKKRTSNHAIIMGRKTYDSIGKPLPNRLNIILSKDPNLSIPGCTVVNTLEEAIATAQQHYPDKEIFIIGGESIYRLAQPFVNKIYLTLVKTTIDGDAFFDVSPYQNWQTTSTELFTQSEFNEYDFEIIEKVKGE